MIPHRCSYRFTIEYFPQILYFSLVIDDRRNVCSSTIPQKIIKTFSLH